MRLDKFLVEMGKGSRSQIKEMAKKGRIQVKQNKNSFYSVTVINPDGNCSF